MNPFPIYNYISPEYFCNRKAEIKQLLAAVNNNRNVTLLSARRMGKTGLLKHFFYYLEEDSSYRVLYVDIMATQNLSDFVQVLSVALLHDEKRKGARFFKRIVQFITSIKGKVVFDDYSGVPSVELSLSDASTDATWSLQKMFEYLAEQEERYIIAIDEFQQITNYPEKNVEAVLRTQIQHQHKDAFIFSGSNTHLLMSIFSNYGRPFYASSEYLELQRLEVDEYSKFIFDKFAKANKNVLLEDVKHYVMHFDVHTYYVQYFFNKLYDSGKRKITHNDLLMIENKILKENEFVYLNYRNLLTRLQFNVLIAVAKAGGVGKIASKDFVGKYNLGQASSVDRAVKSLVDKEMIFRDDSVYQVYDVFFRKWLERF